ncbi:MAG: SCO4848 family membrane protein [Micromonosporaceae bacterium]
MRLSRSASLFLFAFGVWTWVIWPTFVRNIWKDPRSFHHGPTAFLLVHVLLAVVSTVAGTAIGWLGWRGWRGARAAAGVSSRPDAT